MKNIATILVIFGSTVFHRCLCHSDGAPASRCESMIPNHGVNGQTTPSPYNVTVEKPYNMSGKNVKISIESSTENIKGFLIEARKVGESSVIGMFKTPPTNTKYVTCNSNAKGAITHGKRLALKKINFEWEPPKDLSGNISFLATVVKDQTTFWVKVESPELYMMHMSIVPSSTLQTNSTMYSTPVVMSSATMNNTCKYADKAKCGGTQLHHNIVFLFLMGLFLAFW